ncbi:beta-carotene 15,15'-dioxygenase, Brp/Blh family [Mycolicibacterium sp.]|uniref:beta-carotene 15,15'-dioxygenase, Brp/Blh family n=1 Tax=Mycolicibacterium sp. TaxID=2320850 RepID=UPI001A335808|nr:beta-carotene 15,15'-dioxygenase, Brp/Blh family [Mycolicibacterium sp.]MBJ7339478.1 Brp/Blh family beta-carotene 15,15'-dioxygenase [Mycolicibacterium sp.]
MSVAVGWTLVDRSGLQAISPAVAAVGIVVGIPHGAMDHLVPGLTSRRWQSTGHLACVVGGYVVIAAVAALALLRMPDLSFLLFLLASALHFGWAEATYAADRSGAPMPRWRDGWSATIAHGSVVVVLPLWSAEGQAAMRPLVPTLVDAVASIPDEWATGAVLAWCGVAVVRFVARRRVLAAVELIAVLTLFLIVPVFAAFGVYFGLWHAVRHTSRLMDALAPAESIHRQLGAFARAAALPTIGALVVLGFLFALRSDTGVVMTGVSVLLALTFPHIIVVALLDHYRRIGKPVPATTSTAE